MSCSADEAEDVAQDAMVRAYNHRDEYDPMRPARAWLTVIVRHIVIDHHRRAAHREHVVEVARDAYPVVTRDPSCDVAILGILADAAARASSGAVDIDAAIMAHVQGYTYKEIARELSMEGRYVSVAQAKRLARIGLDRLRSELLRSGSWVSSNEPRARKCRCHRTDVRIGIDSDDRQESLPLLLD
jgi:RNA polymerase sigma factor (sigma-70 family)